MPEKLVVTPIDSILIIAPHPDDECIGCGGLLLEHSQQCSVWVLTDGCHGCPGVESSLVATQRKAEFITEMRFLNIRDYHMFELEDGTLNQCVTPYRDEELCRFSKVFVPCSTDIHPDHRAAYGMLYNSIGTNKNDLELYQYEISSPLTDVSHYIDISEYVEKKEQLICLHESQLHVMDYCGMSKALNHFRGITIGNNMQYAEAYRIVDWF